MSRPRKPVTSADVVRLRSAGLTTGAIAENLGISKATVKRIESGERPDDGPADEGVLDRSPDRYPGLETTVQNPRSESAFRLPPPSSSPATAATRDAAAEASARAELARAEIDELAAAAELRRRKEADADARDARQRKQREAAERAAEAQTRRASEQNERLEADRRARAAADHARRLQAWRREEAVRRAADHVPRDATGAERASAFDAVARIYEAATMSDPPSWSVTSAAAETALVPYRERKQSEARREQEEARQERERERVERAHDALRAGAPVAATAEELDAARRELDNSLRDDTRGSATALAYKALASLERRVRDRERAAEEQRRRGAEEAEAIRRKEAARVSRGRSAEVAFRRAWSKCLSDVDWGETLPDEMWAVERRMRDEHDRALDRLRLKVAALPADRDADAFARVFAERAFDAAWPDEEDEEDGDEDEEDQDEDDEGRR